MYIQLTRFPTFRFASLATALGLLSGLGAVAQTNSKIYYNAISPAAACAEGVATTDEAPRQLIGQCETALESRAMKRSDRAATLVNLGTLEARAGQTDTALRRFEKARRIHPGLPDIRVNISAAQIRSGDYDAALETLAAPETVPLEQRHIAHFNRGLAHWHRGEIRGAYDAFAASKALSPDYQPALDMLDNFTLSPASADTASLASADNR